MIARFLRWLSSKLERREICAEDGKLYLERFKLFGWMPGSKRSYPFSVYLHRFHLPDQDDAMHNHPWRWAFSIILTGCYLEQREYDAPRWCRSAGSVVFLSDKTFHRVDRLFGETWTLFVVGPKTGSWGFLLTDGVVVPWRERLEQRGIKASY